MSTGSVVLLSAVAVCCLFVAYLFRPMREYRDVWRLVKSGKGWRKVGRDTLLHESGIGMERETDYSEDSIIKIGVHTGRSRPYLCDSSMPDRQLLWCRGFNTIMNRINNQSDSDDKSESEKRCRSVVAAWENKGVQDLLDQMEEILKDHPEIERAPEIAEALRREYESIA